MKLLSWNTQRCHRLVLQSRASSCTSHRIVSFSRDPDKPTTHFPHIITNNFLNTLKCSILAASLSAAALTNQIILPPASHATDTVTIDDAHPLVDLAKIIPSAKFPSIQNKIRSIEEDTPYRVRILTRYGPSDTPSIEEIRRGWHFDPQTIVVFVDPSSPNILNFKFGLQVQKILPRTFFTELQGRYGNLFYVRDNGEFSAVDSSLDALDVCLRKNGCPVPPGLPQDQYFFTLATSIAGGAIAGAVSRIDPQGFVRRRWVWLVVFFPLWGTLSINFGIGPIVSRTDDPLPVIMNVAATVLTGALIFWYPQAARATGLTIDNDDDDENDDIFGSGNFSD